MDQSRQPYGHTHPSGRKHTAFDESFYSRLRPGHRSDGKPVSSGDAAYEMSRKTSPDVVAYLKLIENDRDPGLTDTTITVGTILPKSGPLAEIGGAMKDVLTAYFANVNDKGGIYNRRIELQTIEAGANAVTTAANAKSYLQNHEVFALVSGLARGAGIKSLRR